MPRHPSILDRLSIVVVAAIFVTAQFGWLPLGLVAGTARVVPTWSICGNDLCACAPTPYCPLCDGAPTCSRTDYSDSQPDDLAITVFELVATPVFDAKPLEGLLAPTLPTIQVERTAHASTRDLGVPTPPPRA